MEYQITLANRSLYCIDVQVFSGKMAKFIHKLLSSFPGFSPAFMSVYIYFDFEYHRTVVSQVSKSLTCDQAFFVFFFKGGRGEREKRHIEIIGRGHDHDLRLPSSIAAYR